MSLLDVKDLTIARSGISGAVPLVRGISFSLEKGEVLGMVGESGSGKTLTALSLMRLLPQELIVAGGSMVLDGKDIVSCSDTEMRAIRGSIAAMIFQEPFTSLNPVLTVGRQIEECFIWHDPRMRAADIKVRALQAISDVGMAGPDRIYSSYPHQLSGGQRQRIMIAMAAALRPKLLIADEPTTALDVTVQEEVLELLKRIRQRYGMSMIFISHDFGIINKMADRVVVLKDGRIIESGRREAVIKDPGSDYTRDLLACARVSGTVSVPRKREPSGDYLISAENISRIYKVEKGFFGGEVSGVKALNDVSVRIPKGVSAGLVGESGSGKSTLGRILLGLEQADHGKVFVKGLEIDKVPRHALSRIAQIVFQDPYSSLDPCMRMGDIVMEGVDPRGLSTSEKDSILKEALSRARLLYKDRGKYPHQFSGGQRQRIAIARALVLRPEFIVLDEPVSSLDVLIQRDILDLLRQLRKEMGLTYLFISHDLRVVRSITDYVYVMHDGRIVEEGATESIYSSPRNEYTSKLLNSAPFI